MVGGENKTNNNRKPHQSTGARDTDDGGVTRLLQKETVVIGPFVVTDLITLAFFFWRNDL